MDTDGEGYVSDRPATIVRFSRAVLRFRSFRQMIEGEEVFDDLGQRCVLIAVATRTTIYPRLKVMSAGFAANISVHRFIGFHAWLPFGSKGPCFPLRPEINLPGQRNRIMTRMAL